MFSNVFEYLWLLSAPDYDYFSQPRIGNPKLFIYSIYYFFSYQSGKMVVYF